MILSDGQNSIARGKEEIKTFYSLVEMKIHILTNNGFSENCVGFHSFALMLRDCSCLSFF